MVPKLKNNDTRSAFKPKRSRDVLAISKEVKILSMIEIKKSYSETARMYGKNESSIRKVKKNNEKIRVSFFVAPQTAKVTAIASDKVLMNVEKALNVFVEDMNRKRVTLFITLYYYCI
jgi:hypothetical protein